MSEEIENLFIPYDGKYKERRFGYSYPDWEITHHIPRHTATHAGQDFSGSFYKKQTTYRIYKLRHTVYDSITNVWVRHGKGVDVAQAIYEELKRQYLSVKG